MDIEQYFEEFQKVHQWLIDANKDRVSGYVEDMFGERQEIFVTVANIVEYYTIEASDMLSGVRTLAGFTGEWRSMDSIAGVILEWFKQVNLEAIQKEGVQIFRKTTLQRQMQLLWRRFEYQRKALTEMVNSMLQEYFSIMPEKKRLCIYISKELGITEKIHAYIERGASDGSFYVVSEDRQHKWSLTYEHLPVTLLHDIAYSLLERSRWEVVDEEDITCQEE